MAITTFKPNEELYNYKDHNPFWIIQPTLDHFKKLLFQTDYPQWLWNTMMVSVVATFISLFASVLAAYAIERLRFRGAQQVGLAIFLAYLVPPSILFIPLATIVFQFGLFDSPLALILTYPTFLIPFCTWLLMGYFKLDPLRARGMRADRRRDALADPGQDHPAAGDPGPDLGRHLRLHAVVERVHLRADLHLLVGEQDRAGRRAHRAGRGRRLSLGLADGRRAARLAAGRDHLLVLRRVLRLEPDRRGEGISHGFVEYWRMDVPLWHPETEVRDTRG